MSETLTPTQRVEANAAIDDERDPTHDLVEKRLALELANELEQANAENKRLKRLDEAFSMSESDICRKYAEALEQLEQAKRQVEELTLKTSLEGYRAMGAQVAEAMDERDQLRAQNAELVKDKERLDWLDKHPSFAIDDIWQSSAQPIRQAIDEARK